jgi:hypothetical protein
MSSQHLAVLCLCLTGVVTPAAAQSGSQSSAPAFSAEISPPPPIAPAVISRDASGKATIRAVRIDSPLRIDGQLDEAIYMDVPAMSDFTQNDPKEGEPASEKTEVWVLFDKDNLYIIGKCWESRPDQIIANEMRRDNINIVQNDQFAWGIDPFFDRRNMLIFEVSAAGGRIDGQVTNERQVSLDWNPIWNVKTSRFDNGYIVEAALPFKSLRYNPGKEQVWGIQFRRRNLVKNEYSYLTPIPASVGSQGHFRAAMAATLVGIEVPQGGRNLDIKPYVRGNVSTDRTVQPVLSNDLGGDVGVDAKYSVTQSLLADLTVNTDFAQVEADEQQVNLTRFSLFFPEKRDFFLENGGIFAFGSTTTTANIGSEVPLIFYSRSIGLANGREVPIVAGGRLSGRAGPYTIGALNVVTGKEELSGTDTTNFSVLRLKRDILRRSSIGMIVTNRSIDTAGLDASQSYGADSNFSFGPDLALSAFWAQSKRSGTVTNPNTYRTFLDYNADRYGAQFDHLVVERDFNAQMGYSRRQDMRKNAGTLRFSPRPKKSGLIRKYLYSASFSNIDNKTTGRLESRETKGRFETQFQSVDLFFVEYVKEHEFLPGPFRIASGVTLPVGDYDFQSGKVGYNFGRQRRVSGNLAVQHGSFYDGDKTTLTISSGRLNVSPQLSVEPSLTVNKVDVSVGGFTQRLVTSRVTYTLTPLAFVSALVQYNEGRQTLSSNIRFRWEYQPGSEMFLVFNSQGDTLANGFADLQNRSVIFKINRVFRF